MTAEHISGELVAGRELDARIATEVMGWYRDGPRSPVWYRPDGSREHDGAGRWPHYSTAIAAAMEVLDQFGGIVTLTRIKLDEWHVTIGGISGLTRWAPTLPLAICRAAIAATAPTEPASVQPLPIEGP